VGTQPKARLEERVWRVARCRPNMEFALGASLKAAGIQSYVPTWSNGTSYKPLLGPSYVLANVADSQIKRAHTCAGFRGWLHFGRIPALVQPEEIEMLRTAEMRQAAPTPQFCRSGEKVRITSGAFARHSGIATQFSSDGRLVYVAIPSICGRAITVELDSREVSPISGL